MFDVELATPRLQLKALVDETIPQLLELIHAGVHEVGVETGSFPPTHLPHADLDRICVRAWWTARVDWKPESWHFDLVAFEHDQTEHPIGMQSIGGKNFADDRTVSTMSWLSRSKHGQGLGKEMRWAALALAFDGLGASKVISGAEPPNLASKGVSLACGYEAVGAETIETRDGPLVLDRFEITADRWRRLERPLVTVKNLSPARRDFGADVSNGP